MQVSVYSIWVVSKHMNQLHIWSENNALGLERESNPRPPEIQTVAIPLCYPGSYFPIERQADSYAWWFCSSVSVPSILSCTCCTVYRSWVLTYKIVNMQHFSERNAGSPIQPRWIIMYFDYLEEPDSRATGKELMIKWCPDGVKVKSRMTFASSSKGLQDALDVSLIY